MYALFAVGLHGTASMLCHYCDAEHAQIAPGVSEWDQQIEFCSAHPGDMFQSYPEKEPGFWVWTGRTLWSHDYETGTNDCDLLGTWSRATAGEVIRFMAGRPGSTVFADRLDRPEWRTMAREDYEAIADQRRQPRPAAGEEGER